MSTKKQRVEKLKQSKEILKALGLPKTQYNDRSGWVFLALADIQPEDSWGNAVSPLLPTVDIMQFIRKDFMDALEALTLEDLADPEPANVKLVRDVGDAWPKIKGSERRADVLRIVEKTKLDLLIAKAKGLSGDAGIRLLIEEEIASEVIVEGLDITTEKLEQVNADIEKEREERERVKTLLEAVENKTEEERVRHLLDNTVSDALIIELAKVDTGALADIKKSIETELKEKQRLAEEEAERKKAEAAGPALEDVDPEEMLEYIESIREILEFSDQEKDIRIMCEQSSIPTSLVDVAVSDPERLDELEKEAEG